jgi:hypothetical protein
MINLEKLGEKQRKGMRAEPERGGGVLGILFHRIFNDP